MESTFGPYTPLYHEQLDDWGLAPGTRIWDASGNFVAVESLKAGDHVFGITFQLEPEYLRINPNAVDPGTNIVQVWRPVLGIRKVLGVTEVTARAWQMTFGDANKMLESRRLVAGGATNVALFPVEHRVAIGKRMVDCYTALQNPRQGSETRQAYTLDQEASRYGAAPVLRPSQFTGMPRGDYAVVIPYEHYAGLTNMLNTEGRTFNRYLFTQVHEVTPLMASTTLYQLHLQADSKPEYGASAESPRCNVIAQTPFAPERKERNIFRDAMAAELTQIGNSEDFQKQWDAWAQTYKPENATVSPAGQTTVETTMQGVFYSTQNNPEQAAALKRFGITGGWLNGGILINIPVGP